MAEIEYTLGFGSSGQEEGASKEAGEERVQAGGLCEGFLKFSVQPDSHWGVGHLVLRALERQSLTLEVIFTAVWTARVQVLSQE